MVTWKQRTNGGRDGTNGCHLLRSIFAVKLLKRGPRVSQRWLEKNGRPILDRKNHTDRCKSVRPGLNLIFSMLNPRLRSNQTLLCVSISRFYISCLYISL